MKCDFGWFKNEHYAFFESITVVIDDQDVSVTPTNLAKYMFLYLAQGEKPSYGQISSMFKGICLLFALLQTKGKRLNEADYKEYFGLVLGFKSTENGLYKRLSAPSYRTVRRALNLNQIVKCLQNINSPFELPKLSEKRNQAILAEAFLEVMGITFKDYKKGGSFNFLGLDIGKHYIDHCANRFEEFFQLAYALRKTYEKSEKICEGKVLPRASNAKSVFIGRVLTGECLANSLRYAGYKDIPKNLVTYQQTYDALLGEFKKQYESVATVAAINKSYVINQIIQDAELPDRFDTFEFVRSMLIAEYVNDWNKPSRSIFIEYAAALNSDDFYSNKTNKFRLTHKAFLTVCRNAINKHTDNLPKSSADISAFIKNAFDRAKFVNSSLVGLEKLKRLCFDVESAASTLFVALTGWRKSEFGFSLASLTGRVNVEILDNLYTPWRFNVNWQVPKTHGESKVHREITSYTYLIAYMASFLNLAGDTDTALYRPSIQSKEENKGHL